MSKMQHLLSIGLLVLSSSALATSHEAHSHGMHDHAGQAHAAHTHHNAMVKKESATNLALSQCWGRFREDNVSALFVDVHNKDTHQAAYIVGVSSPAFADLMIHETYEKDGMKGMRHINEVEIPAGGHVMLKPGGYHVMASQPKQVKVGDNIEVAFKLSNGHEVKTQCVMKPFSAQSYSN
ncbi:copper chaperone PCu(A)C [Pelistega europaea]|nr:copper chaperone PCu(A)C [Pelistega europaea]